MDRHASSAELKAKAKGQMLGKYGTLVPAFLVVEAIMVTINFLATFSGYQSHDGAYHTICHRMPAAAIGRYFYSRTDLYVSECFPAGAILKSVMFFTASPIIRIRPY